MEVRCQNYLRSSVLQAEKRDSAYGRAFSEYLNLFVVSTATEIRTTTIRSLLGKETIPLLRANILMQSSIHQDIKPKNILTSSNKSSINSFDLVFKLVDFGLTYFQEHTTVNIENRIRDGRGTQTFSEYEKAVAQAYD